jgi:hypothetical protein
MFEIMKEYKITNNVGTAKYVVSHHDGVQTHKDGSKFFGITIFKNKKKLKAFTDELDRQGYKN